jgi:hypothetical protein
VTEPTVSATGEPLLFEGEYLASSDFADRLSAVSFRRSVLRRSRVLRIVVLGILVAAAAYVSGLRNGPGMATALAGLGLGIFVVLIVLTYFASFVRGRSHLRKRFPADSTFYIGLRASTLVVRTELATTEVAYAAYRACEPDGDFVFLRRRDAPASTIVPAGCFTLESLTWLAARISTTALDAPPTSR